MNKKNLRNETEGNINQIIFVLWENSEGVFLCMLSKGMLSCLFFLQRKISAILYINVSFHLLPKYIQKIYIV